MVLSLKSMAVAVAVLAAGTLATALAHQPLLPRDCVFSAEAEPGDTCKSMAEAWFITESQFISYNPGVNCAALTPGREYCVEWAGKLPPTSPGLTTTKTSSTSTTSARVTSSSSKKTTSVRVTSSSSKTTTSAPAGPTPTQDGMTKDCNSWHLVQSGDTCQKIADRYKTFSLSQFYSWNPAVGTDCNSLWLGYYVCIGIKGGTTTAKPTTTTSAAPAGPTPTQPNVTNKCKKWHLVQSGDTCQKVSDLFKITLAKFYEWNPDVGSTCASLWLGYYVCVGV